MRRRIEVLLESKKIFWLNVLKKLPIHIKKSYFLFLLIKENNQRFQTFGYFLDSFFSSLLHMACAGIATDLHKTNTRKKITATEDTEDTEEKKNFISRCSLCSVAQK
jgi:hypothetical protein